MLRLNYEFGTRLCGVVLCGISSRASVSLRDIGKIWLHSSHMFYAHVFLFWCLVLSAPESRVTI